jgi:hypothetical protein
MSNALIGNRFKPAEYIRQSWHATPSADDTPESILDPKWWVHVGRQMKAGDRIEILPETHDWYAEAIVIDAGNTWGAKVAFVLGPVRLANDAAVEQSPDFEVKWAGPNAKFRVLRKSDNAVVKDNCQTREEAESWVKSHRKALAA